MSAPAPASQTCKQDQSALTLPAGFCASIFADNIGHARQMAVGANGVVYVNTWSGRLWSDGSYAGIQHTITEGVANPKRYRSPMPAMGGAQLSPQQVAAVAAYVWGLSR